MQMDARIAELVARLTALERERTEIVAEINTLQSARSGKTAAIEVVPSARADQHLGCWFCADTNASRHSIRLDECQDAVTLRQIIADVETRRRSILRSIARPWAAFVVEGAE
jgi:hypothetical protein